MDFYLWFGMFVRCTDSIRSYVQSSYAMVRQRDPLAIKITRKVISPNAVRNSFISRHWMYAEIFERSRRRVTFPGLIGRVTSLRISRYFGSIAPRLDARPASSRFARHTRTVTRGTSSSRSTKLNITGKSLLGELNASRRFLRRHFDGLIHETPRRYVRAE